MSDDAILREKQRRLRKLKEQQARSGRNTPPEIQIEIEDLEAELARLDGSAARAALPRPPQPDFAHPYPIQSGFTGRVAERKLLSAWLGGSPQTILAVIAIGGMGKSALTWAWVQRDVLGLPLPGAVADAPDVAAACRLPESARPEGVLWWSFYETQAGFASFLDEAIGYASDQTINPRDIPSTYDKARALLNLLQQRRLLLVLDGFERELRAYSSLGAAYQGDAVEKQPRGEHRACADPHAGRFLRDAATLPLKSRILITSRLFPRELDDLAGCGRQNLATIDPEDAVAFFHSQGIRGTRAEIQAACAPYGYHALALRLLAGVVKKNRRTPGDIRVASQYPVLPELKGREQHHILEVAYNQLDRPKRALLSRIAAFRSPMTYEALTIFDEYHDDQRFDITLEELEERDLLFFDPEQSRYNLHPVVRAYAYDRLNNKIGVHSRLRDYFAATLSLDEDKLQSLNDLLPFIELYHHTVRAGHYMDAAILYFNHLDIPLYHRLSANQIAIELLQTLFPDGEDKPPRISALDKKAATLNRLGLFYVASGRPRRAIPLIRAANTLWGNLEKQVGDKEFLSAELINLADNLVDVGELAAAEHNLRRSIELSFQTSNKFNQAAGHRSLGRLLTYQGAFGEAIRELQKSTQYSEHTRNEQNLCLDKCHRTRLALLMGDVKTAFNDASDAHTIATGRQNERDRIRVEWLLGTTLVTLATSGGVEKAGGETEQNTHLVNAETHLTEALSRCRRISLVQLEPDILLAWAKWHHLQGNAAQARADAAEALAIADRCEYRLKQADIHAFLARLALDSGDRAGARRHAEIARERAWCDGPPHCYRPALDEAERLLAELERGA